MKWTDEQILSYFQDLVNKKDVKTLKALTDKEWFDYFLPDFLGIKIEGTAHIVSHATVINDCLKTFRGFVK